MKVQINLNPLKCKLLLPLTSDEFTSALRHVMFQRLVFYDLINATTQDDKHNYRPYDS